MITSIELIKKANISRATLNNYIKAGILPKPVINIPDINESKAPRVGMFPLSAFEVLEKVAKLKQQGKTMSEIVALHDAEDTINNKPDLNLVGNPVISEQVLKKNSILQLTLENIDSPAYLVNSKFQIEWCNEHAINLIFDPETPLSDSINERNIFKLFCDSKKLCELGSNEDIVKAHIAIAKKRINLASLLSTVPSLDPDKSDRLINLFQATKAEETSSPLILQGVNLEEEDKKEKYYTINVSYFREGIFFTYIPEQRNEDSLIDFLSRRDLVIRDLLKKRKPYLTPVSILVADLQNSVKICSELPPEEYFELINQIWDSMQPLLRKYHAIHGKHVGDGIVYYFLPQPDSNHAFNALLCAQEMQQIIARISNQWEKKKSWTNKLLLNCGVDGGQEWFGTYQTPTHIEFTVLGDTVNHTGRLSDFAQDGSIWMTKNMISSLTQSERDKLEYGIKRKTNENSEIKVISTYSRISNLVDQDNPLFQKYKDISTLAVAELFDIHVD